MAKKLPNLRLEEIAQFPRDTKNATKIFDRIKYGNLISVLTYSGKKPSEQSIVSGIFHYYDEIAQSIAIEDKINIDNKRCEFINQPNKVTKVYVVK